MGGEITWDCVGGGKFVFTLKLYRDCNGPGVSPSVSLNVWFHPTITSIPLSLTSQTDISPSCNAAGPAITCAAATSAPGWPSSSSPIAGAVQESIYQSAPISIPGVPPSTGWYFTFDECCRNTSITNVPPTLGYGMELRAIMYAYGGINTNPCFDSSPKFSETPSSVVCTGYPFTYNPNAFDPDLDSLSYSWAPPLDNYDIASAFSLTTNPGPLLFNPGFSYTSPLPGASFNPSKFPCV